MGNAQKKSQEIYEQFGGTPMLQSFALSNNADIVKAIDYFKADNEHFS